MKSIDLNSFDQLQKEWGWHQDDLLKGQVGRHCHSGDLRLADLRFHPSKASLKLWNFLMTEEERLNEFVKSGGKLVGTMKDLGTVPVLVYAFQNLRAFYPDGAWWLPCFKAMTTDLFSIAESKGMGEGLCPVRAMLGAFETQRHFPIPSMLVSSCGAVCDDFSAISQRLHEMGYPIYFYQMPHVRDAEPYEDFIILPNNRRVPRLLVDLVEQQFKQIVQRCEVLSGEKMTDEKLSLSIRKANHARMYLEQLRELVYQADVPHLGALEMLISEMLIIHFCSDRELCINILSDLVKEVLLSIDHEKETKPSPYLTRLYWVNPVADLQTMNYLEEVNAMLCGSDFMFPHALIQIPENKPPLQALAEVALCDTMCAPSQVRAKYILQDIKKFRAQGVVFSRIPGASHCAYSATETHTLLRNHGIPCCEIEIQSVSDAFKPAIITRLEALCETIRNNSK